MAIDIRRYQGEQITTISNGLNMISLADDGLSSGQQVSNILADRPGAKATQSATDRPKAGSTLSIGERPGVTVSKDISNRTSAGVGFESSATGTDNATGSNKWLWWAIGIAALAAIAYGGWYYYKKAK